MGQIVPVGVAGMGNYLPEQRLTNHDFERMVDTSDEWIVQRTGIKERRRAAADEYTSDMGTAAARAALEDAGVPASEVDLIICCTVTGDYSFPATACEIGYKLGAPQAGGFDLAAACSGFVFGAQVANSFVASGTYRNVLVVGAEKLSSILDYTDRTTCVLFGDGAGAVLFTPLQRAKRGEYLSGSIRMQGNSADALAVLGGGCRYPPSHETVDGKLHYMRMGGTRVYRFAVKIFASMVEEAMAPYGMDQLGVVIPHQVNQRIIEAAAERIGLSHEHIYMNISRFGNTSSASVPIALAEASANGRLEKGKIVCLVAFGAGLTWGHVLLRW